jgi:AmiR/NasT family two-component response regulator
LAHALDITGALVSGWERLALVVAGLNFQGMQAIVAHPRDAEAELFIRSLQRLGARVDCQWPAASSVDPTTDFLICSIEPALRILLETSTTTPGLAVIGLLDPHNSESMRLVSEIMPHAVVVRPVEPAAIFPNLIVARSNSKYQQRQQSKIAKLEDTLRSYRKVEQAKTILMNQRAIGEPEAYTFLREQAMHRRVSVGVIASAVVELSEVLSEKKK